MLESSLCSLFITRSRDGCKVLRLACLHVCLSARISKTTFPNFLYIFPVAAARFFSDDSAISYVLPVLWMTSCFHITGHICCTARLTAEGCQSAGGDAERGGASALQLRPYTLELRCASKQCIANGSEVSYPRLPCLNSSFANVSLPAYT